MKQEKSKFWTNCNTQLAKATLESSTGTFYPQAHLFSALQMLYKHSFV